MSHFISVQVANHVLGSVLCCPGCFSLYRCQAVRSVLPTYATGVDQAFEFLTKDMGKVTPPEYYSSYTKFINSQWQIGTVAPAS